MDMKLDIRHDMVYSKKMLNNSALSLKFEMNL